MKFLKGLFKTSHTEKKTKMMPLIYLGNIRSNMKKKINKYITHL